MPVIVDAAAEVPPLENWWRFHKEGADMVSWSGGKAIRGDLEKALKKSAAADRKKIAAAIIADLSPKISAKGSDPGAAGPYVMVMNGPQEGTAVPLAGRRGQLVLGRGDGCDLQIEDADASRKHARLEFDGRGIAVVEDAACAIGSEIEWQGKWERIGKPHGDLLAPAPTWRFGGGGL